MQEMGKHFHTGHVGSDSWLPTIKAELAINQKNLADAVKNLQTASSLELARCLRIFISVALMAMRLSQVFKPSADIGVFLGDGQVGHNPIGRKTRYSSKRLGIF